MKITSTIGLITVIFLMGSFRAAAQHSVSGTVVDSANDETLPGVNVVIKGTNTGTATGSDGSFNLEAPTSQDTLVFTFVGYQSREIPINGRNTIYLSLTQQAFQGDDVVVIGYGTTTKEDLTGSVSSVSSNDWEASSINTPDQLMQGRISGVDVSTNSHEPGGGISVNIRGTASLNAGGSPLYVIDGMPINNDVRVGDGGNPDTFGSPPNPMNDIDPSTIESIDVLKDASATAIYGSRAANGVVLITTKQGVAGTQHIDFSASFGVQSVLNKLDLMNGTQWAEQANEAANLSGQSQPFNDPSSFGAGTDWQDVVFRKALQQKYNLSFSGGTETLRYVVSGSHTLNEGLIRGSEFKRYGTTVRIDANPNDRLEIGGSINFTANDNHELRTDNKGYGGVAGIIDVVLEAPPTIPARNDNGEPVNMDNYTLGGGLTNPLMVTDGYQQVGNTLRLINNVHATYDLFQSLSFQTRLGVDLRDFRFHEYYPIGSEAGGAGGTASQADSRDINFLTENTFNFQTELSASQSINAVVGFTYQQNKEDFLTAGAQGFPSDNFTYNNLGLATNPSSPNTYASRWQLVSYLGRINYSYNDTYLLTVTGRYDGSSKFGSNNKFGFFPSIAFGWQLHNEQFIQDLDFFSQFKIRVSYGETGNEAIGTYNSLSTINTSIGDRFAVYWNGQQHPYATISGVANPNLSWEQTSEWNIGLDMGLFDQRLQLSANYYQKKTTDLLLQVPLPDQTGFGSVLDNTGSMKNSGFEFELFSNNMSGDFNWNTNFNIAFSQNEVTSLAGASHIWSGWVGGGNVSTHNKYTVRIEPGHPIGMWYGSRYMGVWESQEQIDQVATMPNARPGEPRYEDVNGDGIYNAESDDAFLGNPNPDFSFGLRNNFNFKQWGLNVFMYGKVGHEVLNLTSEHYVMAGNGVSSKRLNRWTPQNTDTNIPAAYAPVPARVSSFWIEDGSFLRIQNVTLSYNLPVQDWFGNTLRNASIGVAADNFAVITGYSGYDPEVNALGSSNTTKYMDRFAYPSGRTFRMEINLGF